MLRLLSRAQVGLLSICMDLQYFSLGYSRARAQVTVGGGLEQVWMADRITQGLDWEEGPKDLVVLYNAQEGPTCTQPLGPSSSHINCLLSTCNPNPPVRKVCTFPTGKQAQACPELRDTRSLGTPMAWRRGPAEQFVLGELPSSCPFSVFHTFFSF